MFTELAFDPLPVWLARACIATLLAQAAIAKFSDLGLVEQHLAAFGLPPGLLPFGSRVLPLVEALAAALLLSPWCEVGSRLAIGLLLAYGAAMAWHRAQRHELDCGCGGEPLAISWSLVARNVALAAIAWLAGAAIHARAMGLADYMVIVAGVLLGALLYAALHQVLRHRSGSRSHPAYRRT